MVVVAPTTATAAAPMAAAVGAFASGAAAAVGANAVRPMGPPAPAAPGQRPKKRKFGQERQPVQEKVRPPKLFGTEGASSGSGLGWLVPGHGTQVV